MDSGLKIIEDTIDFIEKNIDLEISLSYISKSLFVSKYHLARLFKRMTGFSIMSYITHRRLSLSAVALTRSDLELRHVADQYHFSSSQAYIKAFKRAFKMTPHAYRRNTHPITFTDKFNVKLLKQCGNGIIGLPEIKLMPAFSAAGIMYEIKAADNLYREVGMSCAKEFFFNQSKRIRNPISPYKYLGLGLSPEYFTEITSENQCVYYMPSLLIDDNALVPTDMKRVDIPQKKYAKFSYTGMHNILEIDGKVFYDIWDYILLKWLPTVEYREDGHCCFEFVDFSKCHEAYCEIDFYISVV